MLINKYTKLDPTLPRINTINCPNATSPSNLQDDNPISLTSPHNRGNPEWEEINKMTLSEPCDNLLAA